MVEATSVSAVLSFSLFNFKLMVVFKTVSFATSKPRLSRLILSHTLLIFFSIGLMLPVPKDFFVFTFKILLSIPVFQLKFSGITMYPSNPNESKLVFIASGLAATNCRLFKVSDPLTDLIRSFVKRPDLSTKAIFKSSFVLFAIYPV
jgi:hypothetical protein